MNMHSFPHPSWQNPVETAETWQTAQHSTAGSETISNNEAALGACKPGSPTPTTSPHHGGGAQDQGKPDIEGTPTNLVGTWKFPQQKERSPTSI